MKLRNNIVLGIMIAMLVGISGCSWESTLYNSLVDENGNIEKCNIENGYILINQDDIPESYAEIYKNDKNVIEDNDENNFKIRYRYDIRCYNKNIDYKSLDGCHDRNQDDVKYICESENDVNSICKESKYMSSFEYKICPARYKCYGDESNNKYCSLFEMQCYQGIICDGNCIDPSKSMKYCGAKNQCSLDEDRGVNCEKIAEEDDNIEVISCENSECVIKKCKTGYHLEKYRGQEICIEDSIKSCGENKVDCKDEYAHSKVVECINGACVLKECEENYHVNNDECVEANVYNCAKMEYDCSIYIPGWKNGVCNNKICGATECQKGYHLYEQNIAALGIDIVSCEYNSFENCGEHDKSCLDSTKCASGINPVCTIEGKCECIKCEDIDLKECNHACVDVSSNVSHCLECGVNCKNKENVEDAYCDQEKGCVALSCSSGYHLVDGTCKINDDANCGEEGNKCSNEISNGECEVLTGKCKVSNCNLGYHLETKNDVAQCVPDSPLNCGNLNNNCYELLGVDDVSCGKINETDRVNSCIVKSCQSNYHKDGNSCIKDSEDACGIEMIECKDLEYCINGECTLTCSFTQCNVNGKYVCIDTNTNIAHCGSCDKACLSDQSCVNGSCACKNELHECGAKCVEFNSTEHCGACNNKCSNNSTCDGEKCVCNDKYIMNEENNTCVVDCTKNKDEKCENCKNNSGQACMRNDKSLKKCKINKNGEWKCKK